MRKSSRVLFEMLSSGMTAIERIGGGGVGRAAAAAASALAVEVRDAGAADERSATMISARRDPAGPGDGAAERAARVAR